MGIKVTKVCNHITSSANLYLAGLFQLPSVVDLGVAHVKTLVAFYEFLQEPMRVIILQKIKILDQEQTASELYVRHQIKI